MLRVGTRWMIALALAVSAGHAGGGRAAAGPAAPMGPPVAEAGIAAGAAMVRGDGPRDGPDAGQAMPTPGVAGCVCHQTLRRIGASYSTNPSGKYWEVWNYIDSGGGPAGLPDGQDCFNFTACRPVAGAGEGSYGALINMPDPTIMQIGEWFYLTGTNGAYDMANFAVYRTKNFATFELHMLAFGTNDAPGVRSGQWATDNPGEPADTAHLPNGAYTWLWSGSLYKDPTDTQPDPWVHLTFSAALDAPSLQHGRSHDLTSFSVRMRESDFLSWHAKDPVNDDGMRFADRRGGAAYVAWYTYRDPSNPSVFRYDGGFSLGPGRMLPASGRTSSLVDPNGNGVLDPGELGLKLYNRKSGSACGSDLPLTQRGYMHAAVGAASWMGIDATVWIDPNLPASHAWKRVVMYVWDGRLGSLDGPHRRYWGNNIAAAPLTSEQFSFDTRGNVRSIASARNASNPIYLPNTDGCGFRNVDNGSIDQNGREWAHGSVAEGAHAFYSPATRRYYVLYTRNTWDSGAYQVVYRMTAPDRPFSDLFLTWGTEYGVQEHILLSSDSSVFTVPQGSSYGNAEVITITDCDGTQHPYLVFHAKVHGGYNRTVFFKELTFDGSGALRRLYPAHANPVLDIRRFRVPVCIQSAG